MPTVSVVIPSYRGGPYLREAVDSVRAQTLEDWEVIIVADGCEEDFSDIEDGDARVRVIRQRNRGESISRNVAFGHARGDLVALLDDDDRMLPGRLLAQVEAMKDQSIGLCHTQFRVIDADGAVIGMGESRESQYADFLQTDGAIVLSSAMLRRSIVQEVGGFNPLLPIGQDLDLFYRVARESRLCFLPDILTEYRIHGNNVWANSSSSSGQEIKMILAQHRMVAEARGETENLRAIRKGMKYVLPGRAQFALTRADKARERHDYKEAYTSFAKAMLIAPGAVSKVALRAARRTRQLNKTA
jgi:glycosyltransferase involved in cell wall biosynthesis